MTGDGGRRKVRLTPPPRVGPLGRGSSRPRRQPLAPSDAGNRRRWIPMAAGALLLAALAGGFWLLQGKAAHLLSRPPRSVEVEAPEADAGAAATPTVLEDPRSEISEIVPETSPPYLEQPPPPGPAAPPPAVEPAAAPDPAADELTRAMSVGFAALERRDWEAATAAFERARALSPGAPGAQDGLARAAAGLHLARIESHRRRAAAHQQAEEWDEAATELAAALELEPTATFAREGRRHALERAELARRLDFHLAHPERLAAEAVLEEVRDLLEIAREVEAPGPRHRRQIESLAALADQAETPVPVSLLSDNLTDVTVYRVGRLGTFERRDLELRPGLYTLVGRRSGYRDVRRRLRVEAGKTPAPVMVRCEEKI